MVAENPARRIKGMVTMPVVATLETALPEMEPNMAEATMDIFADPPRNRDQPERALALNIGLPYTKIR